MKNVRIIPLVVLLTMPISAAAHHESGSDPVALVGLWLIMIAVLLATIAMRLDKGPGGGDKVRLNAAESADCKTKIPFFSSGIALAHCDIPCGIYDPATAQIAAISTARLLLLIDELGAPKSTGDFAKLSRLTQEKEKHAGIVKDEIVVIWGDYFKEKQIEMFPDIHDLVHSIMVKASACKQELLPSNGSELMALVNKFGEAFWVSKGVNTKTVNAPYPPNLPMVVPVLD